MTKSKSKSKKCEKNKEATTPSSIGEFKPPSVGEVTPASPSPVNIITRNVPKLWFQNEIQSMMHAFGDSRRPSPDSAILIEEIVHQQMSSVIIRAADVTNMRGGRFMSMEDILFLMRGNKNKLKRLIKYLTFKDLKNKTQKQISNDDDDVLDVAAASELKGSKRRKISYDFLSTIDHTGDLVSLFDDQDDYDEVKQERNERAERLSRTLDHQQYMDYIECKQANFNKKAGKFKEWIDCGSLIDMKPNAPVMEIFSYLAYETVAQVVDLALLVKKNAEGGDVLTTSMPLVSSLPHAHPLVNTLSAATPASTSTTPNHTPPSTPTTPTTSAPPFLPSPTHSTSSNQGIANSSKSKSKKRKSKSSSSVLQEISSDCIQPWHIREALRRYNYYIGPMSSYSPHIKSTPAYTALSC